jgi:hypothetical protein
VALASEKAAFPCHFSFPFHPSGSTLSPLIRRGKPKPMPKPIDGFSPMSDDQWSELLELMQYGKEKGFRWIWIGE